MRSDQSSQQSVRRARRRTAARAKQTRESLATLHAFNKGWQPRQRHPGARITRYRCFLPDLAGFASYRREGADGAAIVRCGSWEPTGDTVLRYGGERGIRTLEAGFSHLHTIQACSFNHSDTSPDLLRLAFYRPWRTCRSASCLTCVRRHLTVPESPSATTRTPFRLSLA